MAELAARVLDADVGSPAGTLSVFGSSPITGPSTMWSRHQRTILMDSIISITRTHERSQQSPSVPISPFATGILYAPSRQISP